MGGMELQRRLQPYTVFLTSRLVSHRGKATINRSLRLDTNNLKRDGLRTPVGLSDDPQGWEVA